MILATEPHDCHRPFVAGATVGCEVMAVCADRTIVGDVDASQAVAHRAAEAPRLRGEEEERERER